MHVTLLKTKGHENWNNFNYRSRREEIENLKKRKSSQKKKSERIVYNKDNIKI